MKAPCSARRECPATSKRRFSPRRAHSASTTAPARAKRSATPTSGDRWPSWNVIAYHVVPQVSTQIANRCQVFSRCMAGPRSRGLEARDGFHVFGERHEVECGEVAQAQPAGRREACRVREEGLQPAADVDE